jgi:hypothetical protein
LSGEVKSSFELSQANLSTGLSALENGCDACYAAAGGGDVHTVALGLWRMGARKVKTLFLLLILHLEMAKVQSQAGRAAHLRRVKANHLCGWSSACHCYVAKSD